MFRNILIFLFLCTLGVSAVEASAMSLLKGEKVCVASGFEGRLTFEGKPASGARIVRTFAWKDEKGETEETITDKDGGFDFPFHYDTLRKFLPAQFVVQQSMFVFYNDQEFQIWGTGKMIKAEYGEFGGKPRNFRCELTDQEVRGVDLEVGFAATTCYWETN